MEGIHGIKGTPQNSGLRAWGTLKWNNCTTPMATMPQAPSMMALGFPNGANCQRRVKMREANEKENRKERVGHGLVVPRFT